MTADARCHDELRRAPAERLTVVRALALVVLVALSLDPSRAVAKNPEEPATAPKSGTDLTFLDHDRSILDTNWPLWLGAQVNSIFQYHPSFSAPHSGPHSLQPEAESAISGLFTIFLAYRPTRTTELILDPEMALGGGLSHALGAAGFPNLDVVRNPTLSHAPYIARAEIHQIIPLSSEWVRNEDRGPLSSFTEVPKHRLDLRFGKMSTVDVFDVNPAGSDSHLQFMNWAVDNNGAYDYAADTRGYTYGLIVEYKGPRIEAHLGEMLMPTQANGIDLDFDFTRARADNLELQIKYRAQPDWIGTVRVLVYQNRANMGSYQEAIDAAMMTGTVPDVTQHRAQGRVKRGVGVNAIQEIAGIARAFGRLGWSTGDLESFAYTEIENTVELGADITGRYWRRPTDRTGLAFVSNGISSDHADYLRHGGLGFLLGDGYLIYGRETIVEHYYNVHVWSGLYFAEGIQLIANPGYNADRGPVWVFSLRGHLEF